MDRPGHGSAARFVVFGIEDLAPDRRGLGIGYVVKHKQEKVIEVFVLEATPPPPPTRWLMRCVGCSRRVVALYLAPGRDRFRCRHCHDLRHHSVQHHDARIDRIRRGDPTPSRSIVWSMLNLRAVFPRPIQRPILRIEVLDEGKLEALVSEEELVSDSRGD